MHTVLWVSLVSGLNQVLPLKKGTIPVSIHSHLLSSLNSPTVQLPMTTSSWRGGFVVGKGPLQSQDPWPSRSLSTCLILLASSYFTGLVWERGLPLYKTLYNEVLRWGEGSCVLEEAARVSVHS